MHITYQKEIEFKYQADVIVIGGGVSGFAAAVSAARHGMNTLLIERSGTLGGMATSGLVGPFMTCFSMDEKEQLVKGIFEELVRRMEKRGSAIHPSVVPDNSSYCSYGDRSHANTTPFMSEDLAYVMDQMMKESGAKTLFYTQVIDVIKDDDSQISSLILCMKEGLVAAKAQVYIDCTGDADVAFHAGVPCTMGNGKGFWQPSSLFFEVGYIDRNRYMKDISDHRHLGGSFSWAVDQAKAAGDWKLNRDYIGNYEQPVHSRWKINCSRMVGKDCTTSEGLTHAQIEGREQIQEIVHTMRKYIPGCEQMQILQVAAAVGVRETRHIQGKYVLTVEDLMGPTHFDDAICSFSYALDIHQEDSTSIFVMLNEPYSIPYRCLLPINCSNLLVAGRCISGTSDAAGSYRVMPCCFALGEAAGTAASIACQTQVTPDLISPQRLQQQLLEGGAYIRGLSRQ